MEKEKIYNFLTNLVKEELAYTNVCMINTNDKEDLEELKNYRDIANKALKWLENE